MVAGAEVDKRDGVEHRKRDTSCFLRSPIGRRGEQDRSLKCEGQVVGKMLPSSHLSFKKVFIEGSPWVPASDFHLLRSRGPRKSCETPPFQPDSREVTCSLTPARTVPIFSVP